MTENKSGMGIGGLALLAIGGWFILYQVGFVLYYLLSPDEEAVSARKVALQLVPFVAFFWWRWKVLDKRRKAGIMHDGSNYIEIAIAGAVISIGLFFASAFVYVIRVKEPEIEGVGFALWAIGCWIVGMWIVVRYETKKGWRKQIPQQPQHPK